VKKSAAVYFARVLVQRALGLFLYLLGAGWALGARAAAYFIVYFGTAILCTAVLCFARPETMAARGRVATDSPRWDKALLGAYWALAYFGVYLAAGLEAGEGQALDALLRIGLALQLAASALTTWAIDANAYLESTARLQTDRGQTVCATGPYAFVRHPAYAAILIWCASMVLTFGTAWTAAVQALIAAIIILRTALEDRMLRLGLDGYEAYARSVRYRLIPYIW